MKPAFDPSQISLVTTCMNRIEFLQRSLLTWTPLKFQQIIIVDWNSEIPVQKELELLLSNSPLSNILIVRSVDHKYLDYFNDGWARNTGARLSKADYILFLDSDIKIINPLLLEKEVILDPNICYRGNIPGGYGSCLVSKDRFFAVNGYSERMWSWGGEDLDLYIRLKNQQGCEIETFFPDSALEHIHHDDNLRTVNRMQEWDDLKVGADVQRLERPAWTCDDKQAKVLASIYRFLDNTKIQRQL